MGNPSTGSVKDANRPPRLDECEPDTSSVSVDLEDLIENFDEYSGKSRSISLNSFSVNQQLTNTYFSARGFSKEDETTSFHTALQDGFSLSEYQPATQMNSHNNQELLWASENHNDRDPFIPMSSFQVYWYNLVYKIEPKITLGTLLHDFERLFRLSLSPIRSLISRSPDKNLADQEGRANIFYKKEPVTIIQQVSGSFKSGELTAVMGPSGAGKTSLLNFLSRRREVGYTGQLYVENYSKRIKISTIPQHDHLPEYLTVRENLVFASRLKNTQPNYDHEKNIEKVSSLLGLYECLDTRTKKISGGQHKRLAIAQELLSKPDILILDEPTSGLDSLTCFKTINVLKDLVNLSAKKLIDPIAIVLTIHQPQQEVFDIFDRVYVMANDGIAIYDGAPGDCTQFIERHSGVKMPDEDYNPASFLIEIASGEYGVEPIKALENQVKLEFESNRSAHDVLEKSDNPRSMTDQSKQQKMKRSSSPDESFDRICDSPIRNEARQKSFLQIDQRIAKGSSMNKGNFWLKTSILSERYWLSIIRDPKQMIARILFHIFLPVCLALMMGTEPGRSNACPKFSAEYKLNELVKDDSLTSNDVQEELLLTLENMGLIFVLIYALSSANIGAITLSFTLDMQSSLKEFHNGWYPMTSYIIARFITDIPMEICLPIITLAIGYPLTGQVTGHGISDGYRVMITALAMILGSMVGTTMGMIFGAIYVGYVSTALFAAQGATLPLVFLSGFVVRTKNMSKLVYALSQMSFYRYILEIAIIARYGFNVCQCNPQLINGHDAELVGVPDRLRTFTKFWLNSYSQAEDSDVSYSPNSNLQNQTNSSSSGDDSDIFQMIAKQISLYNTYGVDVKSCKEMVPYQLYDLSLNESDLPSAFLALIISLVLIKLLLILTVKILIHFRTSL